MFASRVKSAVMSTIRVMMAAAPPGSINLGLGEPDFQPPRHLCEALKKAIDDGYNHYGSTLGFADLRAAVADSLKFKRADIDKDNVMMTVGATGALMTTMQAFVERGDEVLYPNPGFVIYEPQIAFCKGTPIPYSLKEENGFLPDVEQLKELVTAKTKAIVVNTPSNPTGSLFKDEHVKAIIDIAKDNNMMIISDEVYDELIFEGKHCSFMGKCDNLVYINSFSKTYAMTGWRVGYLISSKAIIKEMEKIQYCDIACPPTPFQYALLEGLRGPQDFVKDMLKEFRTRRDYIVREMNTIKGFHCMEPKASFYVFPSFKQMITSKELAFKILEKKVICAPGSAFGSEGEGHLRISYANSMENIKKGVDIIRGVAEKI